MQTNLVKLLYSAQKLQFWTILFPYKLCVKKFEIPYLSTVLLSTSIDKLPGSDITGCSILVLRIEMRLWYDLWCKSFSWIQWLGDKELRLLFKGAFWQDSNQRRYNIHNVVGLMVLQLQLKQVHINVYLWNLRNITLTSFQFSQLCIQTASL